MQKLIIGLVLVAAGCTGGKQYTSTDDPTGDASIGMNDATDGDDGNLVPAFVSKLNAGTSASENDLFGVAVAIDGNVAVVSAMNDAGASQSGAGSVFVFERANGAWSPFQTLSVGEGFNYNFGVSVAVSGDIIVIGAHGDMQLGTQAGAAFVFRRGANTWEQQTKLMASDGAAYDLFGTSVAVHGNLIAIGAPEKDVVNNTKTGAVYLFTPTGVGGAWKEVDKLVAGQDAKMNLNFGYSVAVADNTVAVGSNGDLVQVFELVNTAWTRTGRIVPSTVGSSAALDFGTTVDIDSLYLVIGAPSMNMVGEAYVLERAGNWATNFRELTVTDNTSSSGYGNDVAVHDGHVLVGSTVPLSTGVGAAYFFQRRADGYDDAVKLTATDGSAGDGLGFSAAMSATELLVGAATDDEKGSNSGSAYLWRLD